MSLKLTNNATSTLAGSILVGATSLSVQTADAALFPTLAAGDFFYATLVDASGHLEIIKVTARATALLTIVKGQEGTTDRAWTAGDRIDLRLTAAALAALETPDAVHNATAKTSLVAADEFGFWDSVSTAWRKITRTNLFEDIRTQLGAMISGSSAKTTLVDADQFAISDSAASNGPAKHSWLNLKAGLFTAFGISLAAGTAKATPLLSDLLALADTAATNATKNATIANVVGVGAAPDIVALAPAANQNNYATGANTKAARRTIIKLAPTASIKLTGIDTTSWETGKEVVLRNDTSNTAAGGRLVLLERNSASSSAANRFQFKKGRDKSPILIMPGDEVAFRFDGTDLKLMSPRMALPERWDMFSSRAGSSGNFSGTTGSGAAVGGDTTITDASSVPTLVAQAQTGTTAAGVAGGVLERGSATKGGIGCLLCLHTINIPVLSTGAQEFAVYAGFNDVDDGGGTFPAPVDAIGWKYDRTASVNWRTHAVANSVESIQNSAIAVTANRTDVLGVFVNGDGSHAAFFSSQDNGETWTFETAITTNIPTGNARVFGIAQFIRKSVGTTTSLLNIGFQGVRVQF